MSDKIKMVAGDLLHISAMGAEPLQAGEPFEVDNEADAKRLEAAGHSRAAAPARVVPVAAPKPRTRRRA